MKFVGMVNQVDRPDLDRALWVDEATGKHIVTVYFPLGLGFYLRVPTCVAYAADRDGEITDFYQHAVINFPESASKVANLREPICLASPKALWHVAAIQQYKVMISE